MSLSTRDASAVMGAERALVVKRGAKVTSVNGTTALVAAVAGKKIRLVGAAGIAGTDIHLRAWAHATGTIVFATVGDDGDTFTLDDGVNPATTFELDDGGGVGGGNVAVLMGATARATVEAAVAAINAVGAGLAITATFTSTATVSLRNDAPGTAGNVAITKVDANNSFTVSGMAGGTSPVTDLVTIKSATITTLSLPLCPWGWVETAAGEALMLNSSDATSEVTPLYVET